jgi:lipopolysaccharide transport system ATP-binding protein
MSASIPGDVVIRAHQLGKQYTIHHSKLGKIGSERLVPVSPSEPAGVAGAPRPRHEKVWVLEDVSFEVRQGQVMAVIGRNGAGKSTLLKIISRITEPTAGYADIRGRVGSLLEVGTGFHSDLTGRENVFLNGTILGMKRRDIARRFDEIVTFAEIERYIDTPVKRYSSGMYMRLAFAVAAHTDADILLIDEILAVGDVSFQRKALEKITSLTASGCTSLFVSHNAHNIRQFCDSAIVLDKGHLAFQGTADQAIHHYMQEVGSFQAESSAVVSLAERRDRKGDGLLRFSRVEIYDDAGGALELLPSVRSGQDIRMRFYYQARQALPTASVLLSVTVTNDQGVVLTNLNTRDTHSMGLSIASTGYFECAWPRVNLRPGVYHCNLYGEVNGVISDSLMSAFRLYIDPGDFFETGERISGVQGEIFVEHHWHSRTAEPIA